MIGFICPSIPNWGKISSKTSYFDIFLSLSGAGFLEKELRLNIFRRLFFRHLFIFGRLPNKTPNKGPRYVVHGISSQLAHLAFLQICPVHYKRGPAKSSSSHHNWEAWYVCKPRPQLTGSRCADLSFWILFKVDGMFTWNVSTVYPM